MINYNIHHVNGCRFEITSDDGKGKEYDVQFVDKKRIILLFMKQR